MLDLEKFSKPTRAIVPIENNRFLYNKKWYSVRCENGWYVVEITNNKARSVEPAILSDMNYPAILGYTNNNVIVFQNFDVAKRKYGLGMHAPLKFNQSQTFEAVKAVVWEDGQVYWAEPNYTDTKIFEVKDLFDQDQPLTDQKGITPELRTLFILHSLERENIRRIAEEQRQAEEQDRMMRDIPTRLRLTFERSGAIFQNYSMTGNRIVVDWSIAGSDYTYNSVIDSRTWMVQEAGYCMSGDDRRHNITSMVKTAQEYEDRGVTFITRR